MKKCKFLLVVAAVVVPTLAVAQSKSALSIADNDSIYVDGRSFKIIPGNAKGDASALIRQLGARDLGPAAIIFRKGDKLYVAADPLNQQRYGSDRRDYGSDRDESASPAQAERDWREYQQSLRQNRNRRDYGSDRYSAYGSDRRDYGSDRRDYGSDRDESASPAQAERDWQEYQQSLRQSRNQRGSSSDRRDYGSDRYAGEPDQARVYVNDPDYAQYRLRKVFDENWTTSDNTTR